MLVPNLLHYACEICKIDFLLEWQVGALGGNNYIIDHIVHLHGQFVGLVDVGSVGWIGFGNFAPLLSIFVPLLFVLHSKLRIININLRTYVVLSRIISKNKDQRFSLLAYFYF